MRTGSAVEGASILESLGEDPPDRICLVMTPGREMLCLANVTLGDCPRCVERFDDFVPEQVFYGTDAPYVMLRVRGKNSSQTWKAAAYFSDAMTNVQ